MKFIKKIQQAIGFTDREGYVVVFLVAAFLLGLGIKIFRSSEPVKPAFDYHASDSEFVARSQSLTSADSTSDAAETDEKPPAKEVSSVQSGSSESSDQKIVSHEKTKISLADRVNINTASHDELTTLPGIGPKMADRIIEYRKQHGGFLTIYGVKKVKGIGDKKFEKLAPLITVSD